MDSKNIIEEIDIIIRAKVEEARKDIRSVVKETEKMVSSVSGNMKKLDKSGQLDSFRKGLENARDELENLEEEVREIGVTMDGVKFKFNPKIEGAKVGRGIYSKEDGTPVMESDSESALEYRRSIVEQGRSRLVARPIKPIDDPLQVYELPQSFTREDLKRLRESKQTIAEDTEAYAEEHKNDARYVEYNQQFDELEKSVREAEENKHKKVKKPKILKGINDDEE